MISEEYFANLSQKLQDDTEDFILKLLRRIRRRAQELIGNPDANINLSDEERRIAAQWEAYNRDARKWVDQNLPKAYKRGIEEAARGLPDSATITAGQFASVPLLAGGGFGGDISDVAAEMLADLPRHHTMYGVFQEAAYIGFADTRIPVVRSATDKIRRLTILASDNAYRNADTLTRRELTQEVMRGLSDRGITGIRYSDGRTMKLDSYAEVVARSQTGNAARQAHINRLQEYGRDLILISAHYPVSPLCEPWQGRVYSLSGDSENYPPLERATSGGLYHANCFDRETEVYTDSGWKLFKDVESGDKIMSLNPDTHKPELVNYKKKISYHRDGEMILLDGHSFNLCVTPDHNLYASFSGKENGKRKWKYRLEKAKNAVKKNHRQLRSCDLYDGNDKKIAGLDPGRYAVLMGYFLSEGSVELDKGKVIIHQHDKGNRKTIWKDIKGLGFTKQKYGFVLYDSEICDYVSQFGKSNKKYVPRDLLGLDSKYIRIFLNAFLLGDGYERIETAFNTGKNHCRIYTTSSISLAEGIGEAIMKVGNYPSFKLEKRKGIDVQHKNGKYTGNVDIWYVRENTSKESYHYISPSMSHKGIQVSYIGYDDIVYCLELGRNHIMWVRRKGKTTWSGNCKHSQSGYTHGQKIPDAAEKVDKRTNAEQYEAQQRQRYNERQIRKWKRREATAVTDDAQRKAKGKITEWQKAQREHLDGNEFLRRRYDREQV